MTNAGNPFDQCSESYSRFRPDYPAELIDYIMARCDGRVKPLFLDAGAGTGKAGGPFAARGVPVISVEPSLAMAHQGLAAFPALRYVSANAEQLPVASGSVGTIICGQAFHWFDPARALPEFSTVLRPGGRLFVFWNTRDSRFDQVRVFDGLIHKWNPGHDPGYRDKDWAAVLGSCPALEFVEHRAFEQRTPMTLDDWIGLSRSISYVQSMGPAKLPGFEAELRQQLAALDSSFCPYVTHVWCASNRSS